MESESSEDEYKGAFGRNAKRGDKFLTDEGGWEEVDIIPKELYEDKEEVEEGDGEDDEKWGFGGDYYESESSEGKSSESDDEEFELKLQEARKQRQRQFDSAFEGHLDILLSKDATKADFTKAHETQVAVKALLRALSSDAIHAGAANAAGFVGTHSSDDSDEEDNPIKEIMSEADYFYQLLRKDCERESFRFYRLQESTGPSKSRLKLSRAACLYMTTQIRLLVWVRAVYLANQITHNHPETLKLLSTVQKAKKKYMKFRAKIGQGTLLVLRKLLKKALKQSEEKDADDEGLDQYFNLGSDEEKGEDRQTDQTNFPETESDEDRETTASSHGDSELDTLPPVERAKLALEKRKKASEKHKRHLKEKGKGRVKELADRTVAKIREDAKAQADDSTTRSAKAAWRKLTEKTHSKAEPATKAILQKEDAKRLRAIQKAQQVSARKVAKKFASQVQEEPTQSKVTEEIRLKPSRSAQMRKEAQKELKRQKVLARLPKLPQTVDEGDAREITREMEKNRGLTRKRKKYEGHARVHNRIRYAKKLRQMTGRAIKAAEGSASGDYAGEVRGFTPHVRRSHKL